MSALLPRYKEYIYAGITTHAIGPYAIIIKAPNYQDKTSLVIEVPSWSLQSRIYPSGISVLGHYESTVIRGIHPLEFLPVNIGLQREIKRVYLQTGRYFFIGFGDILFEVADTIKSIEDDYWDFLKSI